MGMAYWLLGIGYWELVSELPFPNSRFPISAYQSANRC